MYPISHGFGISDIHKPALIREAADYARKGHSYLESASLVHSRYYRERAAKSDEELDNQLKYLANRISKYVESAG